MMSYPSPRICYSPKNLEEAVTKYQIVKGDLGSKTSNIVGEYLG